MSNECPRLLFDFYLYYTVFAYGFTRGFLPFSNELVDVCNVMGTPGGNRSLTWQQ